MTLHQIANYEKNQIIIEHPNSMGTKYLIEKSNHPGLSKMDIITKIVLDTIEKNKSLFPEDIAESTVIHLRIGDVVAGNEWHEKNKRPLKITHLKSVLENDPRKKYVIGKSFFASGSSTNYEECIERSNEYLQKVLTEVNAEHFDSGDADIDFCAAVQAKQFVQGKGFYSKLIVAIRLRLNLPCIQTASHD
jgi:hypothetical protein